MKMHLKNGRVGPLFVAAAMVAGAAGCSDVAAVPSGIATMQTGGLGLGGQVVTSGGLPMATGGIATTGGVLTSGGQPSTGGLDSTGGMPASGGDPVAASGGDPVATSGGDPVATGGVAASGGMAQTGGTLAPIGPEQGDPNGPIVEIDEVACGGSAGLPGLGSPNFTLGGREMIVTYPCGKRAGAPMTFVLNLHGTTPVNLHFYQHGYFPVHRHADSHNLIVVTPSSVVQQWGNGDNGVDEPHLMEVIDWVYSAFSAYDIRGMWVAGHSWGGMYTARFGCKPELADKVVGLFMQSGGGVGGFGGASCADRASILLSMAEGDGREPSDQSSVAGAHGCGDKQTEMIGNNRHDFWTDCDPGYAHASFYMLGKQHADAMDATIAEKAADWIKSSRR